MRTRHPPDAQSHPVSPDACPVRVSLLRNEESELLMPRLPKKRKAQGQQAAQIDANAPVPTIQRIGDLAWAGQHATAIELATTALAASRLSVADRLDLLDLRAESLVAVGDLERAGADAAAMLDLANAARSAALKAQAQNRRAVVQMRNDDSRAALATATAALKTARQSK